MFSLYQGFNQNFSNEMTSLLTICVFLQMAVNIDGSVRDRFLLQNHEGSPKDRFEGLSSEEVDYKNMHHNYPGKIPAK